MKPEAGQYYQTRDGRKAFVSATIGGNPFTFDRVKECPAIGYVEDEGQVEWTSDGHYFNPERTVQPLSDLDLMVDWEQK